MKPRIAFGQTWGGGGSPATLSIIYTVNASKEKTHCWCTAC
jgi:hypothetical protein